VLLRDRAKFHIIEEVERGSEAKRNDCTSERGVFKSFSSFSATSAALAFFEAGTGAGREELSTLSFTGSSMNAALR
jgi:hypothetical protein